MHKWKLLLETQKSKYNWKPMGNKGVHFTWLVVMLLIGFWYTYICFAFPDLSPPWYPHASSFILMLALVSAYAAYGYHFVWWASVWAVSSSYLAIKAGSWMTYFIFASGLAILVCLLREWDSHMALVYNFGMLSSSILGLSITAFITTCKFSDTKTMLSDISTLASITFGYYNMLSIMQSGNVTEGYKERISMFIANFYMTIKFNIILIAMYLALVDLMRPFIAFLWFKWGFVCEFAIYLLTLTHFLLFFLFMKYTDRNLLSFFGALVLSLLLSALLYCYPDFWYQLMHLIMIKEKGEWAETEEWREMSKIWGDIFLV